MKKGVTVLLIVALMVISQTGCGKTAGADPVTSIDGNTSGELLVYINNSQNITLNFPLEQFKEKYPNITVTIADQDYYGIEHEDGVILAGQSSLKMKAELMAGAGPDLLFLSSFADGTVNDLYKMPTTGVFEDLSDFANTTSFKGDYSKGLMNAGLVNEKQYYLPIISNPQIYITTKEALEKIGATPDDCKTISGLLKATSDYAIKNPQSNLQIFENYYEFVELASYFDLANYKDKTINISNEIKEALPMLKTIYAYDMRITGGDFEKNNGFIKRDEIKLGNLVFERLSSLSQAVERGAILNGDFTPVLIPIANDNKEILFKSEDVVAVNSQSKNKDIAYEFINTVLSFSYNNSKMSDELKALSEPFTLGKGQSPILSQTKKDLSYWKETIDRGFIKREEFLVDGETNIAVTPLTQSFYDEYLDICSNSIGVLASGLNNTYSSKFSEIVLPYLNNEISLETCISELENTLTIYISE